MRVLLDEPCARSPSIPTHASSRDSLIHNAIALGWGTTVVDDGSNYVRIPNKNVVVRDNIFANPSGFQSQWQHVFISGACSGATQTGSNVPSPALADDGLVITGNVIENGGSGMSLGLGEDSGCQDSNPTCNKAQLLRDNDINED